MRRRIRGMGAAAAAIVLASALGGCSAITTAATIRNAVAGTIVEPKQGDCWTARYSAYTGSESWTGGAPVPCRRAHQVYTYAMTTLTGDYRNGEFAPDGTFRSEIDDDAYEACNTQLSQHIPALGPDQILVYPNYFLPSRTQWAKGDRWVRCDIAKIKVGSPVAHPVLANLPGIRFLIADISANPARYDYCVNDPGGTPKGGPTAPPAVYADCTKHPDWTLRETITMKASNEAKYPTAGQFAGVTRSRCDRKYGGAGRSTYVYLPTKDDWTQQYDHDIQCWVSGRRIKP